jgi:hypothetical protein
LVLKLLFLRKNFKSYPQHQEIKTHGNPCHGTKVSKELVASQHFDGLVVLNV